MSAETIPAEVLTAIGEELLCHGEFGATTTASRAGAMKAARAVMRVLADRSTRPAKPAAPVAEARDGEVSRYIAKCREMSKGENGHTYTWWSRLADLLSTLEAERARADELRRLLTASGRCVDDLTARVADAERDRDVNREAATKYYERMEAAEQRAADALVRAEKAQVALLSASEAMFMARDVLADPSTTGIDDVIWMPEAVSMNETLHDYLERAAEFAARASREAQPATDGGEADV